MCWQPLPHAMWHSVPAGPGRLFATGLQALPAEYALQACKLRLQVRKLPPSAVAVTMKAVELWPSALVVYLSGSY
jgi:hypothetical protein